jgi:cytochrome P450
MEVDSCVLSNEEGSTRFDVDRLLKQPVLQAVYAETLRLRMHFYIIRMPDRIDMNINDWIIPKRQVIVTSTTAAHLDPKSWNISAEDEHPIDTFWPGRFLKERSSDQLIFSTKELDGAWIPYGGGPRQCPGRHFAKRQILLTAALMVTLFDCEISEEGMDIKEDLSLKGFGSGVSHAAGKVPVLMRARKQGR